jgi:outer membrane lipoprotein-sorting protein
MYIFLLLVPAAQSFAEANKLPAKYENLFASIEHLTVDFSQSSYKKLRNRTTVRNGSAHFSKPSMFRWNFVAETGAVEEYYYNGEKLTHFREKEKLVNHYNTNAGLAKELTEVVNLVLDPKVLLSVYKIKESKSQAGKTQVVFNPINPDVTDVESIFVTIQDNKKFVEEVQIFYRDGNNTKFAFKNPSYSKNSKDIFVFSRTGNFTVRHHG